MSEFRVICDENGENRRAFQDLLLKELMAVGYIAIVGSFNELGDDGRLLNPRFVNYFLFSRILRHQEAELNHGFMRRSWLESIMEGVGRVERELLNRLME